MIDPKDILETLSKVVTTQPADDGVRVATHCLYPSNSAVSVVVKGGQDLFVVSDEGGAIHELSSAGLRVDAPDRFIRRIIKRQGLKVDDGVIVSPPVPAAAIGAAIMLVANASKEAADWALDHLKFGPMRHFKRDLSDLLERYFHGNLKHDAPILGASNKAHKFMHVVYLLNDRRLIIDPAINEASSINARVVANLDVRMTNDPLLEQFIVYDDSMEWSSSDLKLLEVGAPTIPFSHAEKEIRKRA